MSGLTKLGLALVVTVAVSALVFSAADLLCIFFRRRRREQEPSSLEDPEIAHPAAPGGPPHAPPAPLRQRLLAYVLCFKKNRARVEPASAAAVPSRPSSAVCSKAPSISPEAATDEAELARWQGVYASRALFTIREEEGDEGLDSPSLVAVVNGERANNAEKIVAEELESAAGDTPFAMPCASPPFYTPTASPGRAVYADGGEIFDRPEEAAAANLVGWRGRAVPSPEVEEAAGHIKYY